MILRAIVQFTSNCESVHVIEKVDGSQDAHGEILVERARPHNAHIKYLL